MTAKIDDEDVGSHKSPTPESLLLAAKLEETMDAASAGDESAAEEFYRVFLQSAVFVPDRYQTQPLTNQPDYPSQITSLMGLKDGDRSVIPAFTQVELIEDWFGQPLAFRQVPVVNLIPIVPEDWWLCLNPGSEIQKEFSPWELSLLKQGEESVGEILDELREVLTPLKTSTVAVTEYLELKKVLAEEAQLIPEISRLHLATEEGFDNKGDISKVILLGIVLIKSFPNENDIVERMQSVATLHQLGAIESVKVAVMLETAPSLILQMFEKSDAFYKKAVRKGIFTKVKGMFGG